MGLFLQTAIIPHCDEKTVRGVLESLAQSEDSMELDVAKCLFSANDKGVQILFNDYCMGYERLAECLSKETGRDVLFPYIYDGDFWGYFFCKDGALADQFVPIPDYFGEEAALPDVSGNAALIAERFHVSEEDVARYLTSWAPDDLDGAEKAFGEDRFPYGDCWQMVDFTAKLGWPWPWD